MKKVFSVKRFVLSGLCGLLFVGPAVAQQPATQPAPREVPVVIVDVQLLLMNHPKQAEIDRVIRQEIAEFEPIAQKERAELTAMRQELLTMNPGSPEYVQKDAAFQSKSIAFRQEADLKSRDIERRRLLQTYQIYCEIQDAVAKFSQQYNVSLVLVSSSAKLLPADPENPIDANVAMSRSAIYAKPSHDITDAVAQMLNIPLQVQSPSVAMGARVTAPVAQPTATAPTAAATATQPAAARTGAQPVTARTATQPAAARR
ncbi:MAG: OmpH family outer membrane protein [Planctomycetia bacterium]|nr:OmpH family outer membrane protein [Planctomycetia bacterium]